MPNKNIKKNITLIQNGMKKIIKKTIMPHNSEKSSITNRSIKPEKFYPSIYIFKSNKNIQEMQTIKVKILKKNNSFNTKLFRLKPIIAHKSQGTSITKEEIGKRKMNSLIFTSVGNYQKKALINKIRFQKKNLKIKKYKEIPIIAHNSEKPSIAFEEINGRKINSNIFTSLTNYQKCDKLENKNIKNKKNKEIPVVAHKSEKPSISFEEINGGKMNSIIFTSFPKYQKNIDDKKGNKKIENKIYNEIPIIIHNSIKPSILYEEINGGKMNSFIFTSKTNYQKHLDDKLENKNIKIKKYKEIPIIPHKSENPSISYEEKNSIIITSITNYQKNLDDKFKLKSKNKNTEKYIEIPIIAHKSENPSISFEQINAGKMSSFTFINYKKQLNDKILNGNNNQNNKKYIEIPIISHNSEKPSISFEQINSGKMNKFSYSPIKIKHINKNVKKYIEIPIISHNSQKPSISFEQINSGKMNKLINTSKINDHLDDIITNRIKNINNKNYTQIPIISHNSEKPSILFEEINEGKLNSIIPTSITNYNDNNIKNENHTKRETTIIYEGNNSVKHKNNIQSSNKEFNLNNIISTLKKEKTNEINSQKSTKKNFIHLKKEKYKDIPIVIHESQKPGSTFEEANTGIPRILKNKFIFY